MTRDYDFSDKAAAQDHFTRMTGLMKNLNYAAFNSSEYRDLTGKIEKLDESISEIILSDAEKE